jgi:hypothetical protein
MFNVSGDGGGSRKGEVGKNRKGSWVTRPCFALFFSLLLFIYTNLHVFLKIVTLPLFYMA